MHEFILPYLAKHKQLSLDGIGTFYKNIAQPSWNASTQSFENPTYEIQFEQGATNTNSSFLDYVALKMKQDVSAVEHAIDTLKEQSIIEIPGLGILTKNNQDNFDFSNEQLETLQNVVAPRAIHQDPHQIRVGENIVTNEDMNAYYEEGVTKKRWTWLHTAISIAAVSLIYIGYYFYSHR